MLDRLTLIEQIVVMKPAPHAPRKAPHDPPPPDGPWASDPPRAQDSVSRRLRLADLAFYQLGWVADVFGARAGHAAWGVAAVLAYAGLHAIAEPQPRRARDLIALSTLAGIVIDSALVLGGAIEFPAALRVGPLPTPLWMLALWTAFGAAFSFHYAPLTQARARAWLLGALGGPAVYAYLAYLGVLTFPRGPAVGLLAIALVWAPTMAGLRAIFDLSRPAYASTQQRTVTGLSLGEHVRPTAARCAAHYFSWLSRCVPGVHAVQGDDRVVLRLFGLPAISMRRQDEAAPTAPTTDDTVTYDIVGGLFARPSGHMRFSRYGERVVVDLVGFVPRYSPVLYALTHARIHAAVMNAWLRSLGSR